MMNEPDIQEIKREILERAIRNYEVRIMDLKTQMNEYSLSPHR